MKKAIDYRNIARLFLLGIFVASLTLSAGQTVRAAAGPAPVNLGTASSFVVLTKTGVTNVPTSDITGNIGASPIASTAITGFSLIADSTNTFSRSAQVTGKVYAANYASPTPSNLTVAIGNMQTAYTDAAGRSLPDFTELYAGDLSGKTLVPGLYKWSTGVLITSDVTLAGPADAVWIFQIAGNLTMTSGARMLLSGGAQPRNIFWQVAGGVGVEIGTTAHVEGTLLAAKAIHFRTGASLNGRALAQTAVTLEKNVLVIPSSSSATKTPTGMPTKTLTRTPVPSTVAVFTSNGAFDGWVLESHEGSNVGRTTNHTASTFNLGDDAANKQYRSILHFDTASLPDTAVITQVMLKIMARHLAGINPFTTHGGLLADVRKVFFGTAAALQGSDFQANDGFSAAGRFDAVAHKGWYGAVLKTNAQSFISRTEATQFRLRFALDDNNDGNADYLSFYSGNAATLANRPKLIVEYYLP